MSETNLYINLKSNRHNRKKKRHSISVKPPRKIINFCLQIPGLPPRTQGDHSLEGIVAMYHCPDVVFTVRIKNYRMNFNVNWRGVLGLRPYHILNDYVNDRRSNSRRNKFLALRNHTLLRLISFGDRLWPNNHLNFLTFGHSYDDGTNVTKLLELIDIKQPKYSGMMCLG